MKLTVELLGTLTQSLILRNAMVHENAGDLNLSVYFLECESSDS